MVFHFPFVRLRTYQYYVLPSKTVLYKYSIVHEHIDENYYMYMYIYLLVV